MIGKNVRIDYTNWRGERRMRVIRPLADGFRFTKNNWHSEQWLLRAQDVETGEIREFAMASIHSWTPAAGGQ